MGAACVFACDRGGSDIMSIRVHIFHIHASEKERH